MSVHLLIHGPVQHNQLICHHSESQPIQLRDGPTLPSVSCTQTSISLSLCHLRTRARPSVWCNLNLDSSVNTQCRKWQMSQIRWRIGHWWRRRRCTKVRLGHHAGLWECYPAASRCQGLYSLSGKTSYRQISWSLEAARLGVIIIAPLWNLTGASAAALPKGLSNFRAIGNV